MTRLEARRVDVDPFVVARWPLVVRVRVALPNPVHHSLESNVLCRVPSVARVCCQVVIGRERTSKLSIQVAFKRLSWSRHHGQGRAATRGTTYSQSEIKASPELVPVKRAIRFASCQFSSSKVNFAVERELHPGILLPVTANGECNDLGKASQAVRDVSGFHRPNSTAILLS